MPYFGPAGNSPSFYDQGGKSSEQMPRWLAQLGLNAYEYQASRGVRVSRPLAEAIAREAVQWGVKLSIHAPYYINLASGDPQVTINTRKHLMASLELADMMNARVVVFHPGSGGGKGGNRSQALNLALQRLDEIVGLAANRRLSHIKLAVETAGKQNQLGHLEEIIALCRVSDQVIPCIDFAHLHALGGGCINTREDYLAVIDQLEHNLGPEVLQNLHVHFSPIEYTTGGEKQHRTLAESPFGPSFAPLAQIMVDRSLEWTVICESKEMQAEDALAYLRMWEQAKPISKNLSQIGEFPSRAGNIHWKGE